jgi:hypothetical protein
MDLMMVRLPRWLKMPGSHGGICVLKSPRMKNGAFGNEPILGHSLPPTPQAQPLRPLSGHNSGEIQLQSDLDPALIQANPTQSGLIRPSRKKNFYKPRIRPNQGVRMKDGTTPKKTWSLLKSLSKRLAFAAAWP